MKKNILFYIFSTSVFAFSDPKVGGTIYNKKFAELKSNSKSFMVISVFNPNNVLLAMVKLRNPIFPQAFVVTPKNLVRPDLTLDGNVKVIGKYYPEGESGKIYNALPVNADFVSIGKKDLGLEVVEEGH